jgi:hypothetical protein
VNINAHFRIKGVFDNLVKFVNKLGNNWQTRAGTPFSKLLDPHLMQHKKNVKNIFLSMCDVKVFLTFASLGLL